MSLDVSSIVTMHGQVYKDSGQGVKDLASKFYQPSVTDAEFKILPTDETVKHMGKVKTDRVLQLFQKVKSRVGGTTITGLKALLTPLKVEDSVFPDDLTDTWAGFLNSLDSNDRTKWPFIKWLLEMHVLPKSIEDWELYEVYKGTQDTVDSSGTANAAGKNNVGLRKQINLAITAGTLTNVEPTGALSTDGKTFVEQLEAWVRGCKENSPEDRLMWESGEIKSIYMAPSNRDLVKVGMGEKYNVNYRQVDLNNNLNVDNNVTLFNSNVRIVGLPSMIGDNKIWAMPEWNKRAYIKRPLSSKYFGVAPDGTNVREVQYWMDFWKHVGFWMPEYVYTNDLELV
jgi:hypothetical protein